MENYNIFNMLDAVILLTFQSTIPLSFADVFDILRYGDKYCTLESAIWGFNILPLSSLDSDYLKINKQYMKNLIEIFLWLFLETLHAAFPKRLGESLLTFLTSAYLWCQSSAVEAKTMTYWWARSSETVKDIVSLRLSYSKNDA